MHLKREKPAAASITKEIPRVSFFSGSPDVQLIRLALSGHSKRFLIFHSKGLRDRAARNIG